MSKLLRLSHNASNLVYHLVCPIKYRRDIITERVKHTIMLTCSKIETNHKIYFIEVGTDGDHVHFLFQSVPTHSPTSLVKVIKINIAKAIFKYNPEVKRYLWAGELWTDGFYMNTVSAEVTEKTIANYVKRQGNGNYCKIQ